MEIEIYDTDGKYQLIVDSHNYAQTFGVARSKKNVEFNKRVLELPPKEIILNEIDTIENSMILFPFGRYIVVYQFEKEILFFIDYSLEVDKPILELLLQCKVTQTFLEHFLNLQFKLQTTLRFIYEVVYLFKK